MKIQTITSLQNDLIKYLVKLRVNRDYRYEHHRVIIEGKKCVEEISKTHPLIKVFATNQTQLENTPAESHFLVPDHILQKISGTHNPEGIIAEIDMPPFVTTPDISRLLILDEINDPGNMGTLIRTALAFGWKGIFLLGHCCDPYNDKALRAAKGATFRMPLSKGTAECLKQLMDNSQNKTHLLAADLKGKPAPQISVSDHCMLVLGNEANGISKEIAKLAELVSIPMQGPMESLNVSVAGAILMYQLQASMPSTKTNQS